MCKRDDAQRGSARYASRASRGFPGRGWSEACSRWSDAGCEPFTRRCAHVWRLGVAGQARLVLWASRFAAAAEICELAPRWPRSSNHGLALTARPRSWLAGRRAHEWLATTAIPASDVRSRAPPIRRGPHPTATSRRRSAAVRAHAAVEVGHVRLLVPASKSRSTWAWVREIGRPGAADLRALLTLQPSRASEW